MEVRINFTPRPPYPPGKNLSIPIEYEAGWVPKSGGLWERENLLHFQEKNTVLSSP